MKNTRQKILKNAPIRSLIDAKTSRLFRLLTFQQFNAFPYECGMSSFARVTIHASQFPDAIRLDLLESLRIRAVNHKFHYDSAKQTQKWLDLHQAYSPSRTDADCASVYEKSFIAAANGTKANRVHLIGLGCGGGKKDSQLLRLLGAHKKAVSYTPSDVSTAMVLVARAAALEMIPENHCSPLAADLATANDLAGYFDESIDPRAARLITFFGMIPNFEPHIILPRLAALIRPEDTLLFSANLAPGKNYSKGVKKILPLYDNDLTREWLLTFLLDLGVERRDGAVKFRIEDCPGKVPLKRVVAEFIFSRPHAITVEEERFAFGKGDKIRLFFSYRHTPKLIRALLEMNQLQVRQQWITKSGEEGVFLCRRV